jgi:hypothetical protein
MSSPAVSSNVTAGRHDKTGRTPRPGRPVRSNERRRRSPKRAPRTRSLRGVVVITLSIRASWPEPSVVIHGEGPPSAMGGSLPTESRSPWASGRPPSERRDKALRRLHWNFRNGIQTTPTAFRDATVTHCAVRGIRSPPLRRRQRRNAVRRAFRTPCLSAAPLRTLHPIMTTFDPTRPSATDASVDLAEVSF